MTGDEGLRLGQASPYAVMLIDRMLPGVDRLSLIQRLRDEGNDAPALIISALGEVDERVRGLRSGGDGRLTRKPFALSELLARVEALARRSATIVKETILRAGDLELDLVSRAATRALERRSNSCLANLSSWNITNSQSRQGCAAFDALAKCLGSAF